MVNCLISNCRHVSTRSKYFSTHRLYTHVFRASKRGEQGHIFQDLFQLVMPCRVPNEPEYNPWVVSTRSCPDALNISLLLVLPGERVQGVEEVYTYIKICFAACMAILSCLAVNSNFSRDFHCVAVRGRQIYEFWAFSVEWRKFFSSFELIWKKDRLSTCVSGPWPRFQDQNLKGPRAWRQEDLRHVGTLHWVQLLLWKLVHGLALTKGHSRTSTHSLRPLKAEDRWLKATCSLRLTLAIIMNEAGSFQLNLRILIKPGSFSQNCATCVPLTWFDRTTLEPLSWK